MDGTSHREIERLLLLLTQQAPDHAFMMIDVQGRVAWWSKGAEHIFGHTAEQIIGKPAEVLFAPDDQAARVPEWEIQVALRDGPAEDDRWMMRRDGSRFWANGILVAIRGEDGQTLAYGKVLRNRTDVKEQLDALRNLAREAQADARRRDVFLGMLSHELRNPLGPIANAVAIVRAASKDLAPEASFALNVIERQMHLLERLVQDLGEHSRVAAGKVDLRLEPVVLQELLGQVVADHRDRARARRQQLELIATEGAILVNADRDRLRQVVTNLVVNALKYTHEDGHIWVKAVTEGDEALLKVEDNGIGIPTEMLPLIFDLFTQVESSRGESQGGLGLGLALVKELVTLHGGTVQVRSDGVGKGSEFTVRLPLSVSRPDQPSGRPKRPAPTDS